MWPGIKGLTDTQVAEQLIISPRTVNMHLTAIYNKIGVSNRSGATHYAIQHNLISVHEVPKS
jgi:DNA-binding CsgD family transcriptional regulator